MKTHAFGVIAVLIFLSSCVRHESGNSEVVPESTFVSYYADRLVFQEEFRLVHPDSALVHQKQDSLCRHYGVTPEKIARTTRKYQQDLAVWRQFYDKVVKRLAQLQKKETTRTKEVNNQTLPIPTLK
jgi:hypothetical protein